MNNRKRENNHEADGIFDFDTEKQSVSHLLTLLDAQIGSLENDLANFEAEFEINNEYDAYDNYEPVQYEIRNDSLLNDEDELLSDEEALRELNLALDGLDAKLDSFIDDYEDILGKRPVREPVYIEPMPIRKSSQAELDSLAENTVNENSLTENSITENNSNQNSIAKNAPVNPILTRSEQQREQYKNLIAAYKSLFDCVIDALNEFEATGLTGLHRKPEAVREIEKLAMQKSPHSSLKKQAEFYEEIQLQIGRIAQDKIEEHNKIRNKFSTKIGLTFKGSDRINVYADKLYREINNTVNKLQVAKSVPEKTSIIGKFIKAVNKLVQSFKDYHQKQKDKRAEKKSEKNKDIEMNVVKPSRKK